LDVAAKLHWIEHQRPLPPQQQQVALDVRLTRMLRAAANFRPGEAGHVRTLATNSIILGALLERKQAFPEGSDERAGFQDLADFCDAFVARGADAGFAIDQSGVDYAPADCARRLQADEPSAAERGLVCLTMSSSQGDALPGNVMFCVRSSGGSGSGGVGSGGSSDSDSDNGGGGYVKYELSPLGGVFLAGPMRGAPVEGIPVVKYGADPINVASAWLMFDFPLGGDGFMAKMEAWQDAAVAEMEAQARICDSCGEPGARLKCRACRRARYCSKDCQAAAWGAGHREQCAQQQRRGA
jgi:hypothetical protein